ncbi:hypothetical protein MKZ07_29705 [Paenibacillus sp. FSL P4-0338]|uniref:hypothetical protein n=1 Tax=unclassified Paenibacillus TaxID=185978 RepID=UPI0003E24AA2|nr:hypothetical protein [Paenibacillus sp. FSL R7-269]ETT45559.1 hypothetical protein C162_20841 [Paenibacillus sp. FSL R7-269]
MKKLIVKSVGIVALISYIVGCTDPSQIQTAEAKAAPTQTPKPAAKADNINALIPAGWHILEPVLGEKAIAKGDLNKDGVSDLAMVIEKNSVKDEASPRSLLIAFGGKNNKYTLSIIAKNVILRADEGGVWGDPFDSLTIDRGSVLVSDYGGSNWRWYNKYRFRYQDKDWFLIGYTSGSYFTGATTIDQADEDDINFLTGQFIERRTDEQGHTTTKKGTQRKKPLIRLKEFNSENL